MDVLGVNPLKKGTVPFCVDVDGWRGTAGRLGYLWRISCTRVNSAREYIRPTSDSRASN